MRKLFLRLCGFVFGKYSSNSISRIWVIAMDIVILVFSYFVSVVLLNFNNGKVDFQLHPFLILVATYIISFLVFKPYVGMIRYSGFNDIRKILLSTTVAVATLIGAKYIIIKLGLFDISDLFPRYQLIIFNYLILLALMVIVRLTIRRIYNEFFRNKNFQRQNVLVYGAGDGGILVYRAINQDTSSPYKIVAFVDDNLRKANMNINGVRIYKPDEVFNNRFIDKHNIKVMVVAIPSLTFERRKKIIEQGIDLGLKVKAVPAFDKWIDGEITTSQITDIKIEDLLGRDPIELGKENVIREINGKVVMVTGAAGSIGSEMCRQVLRYNPAMLIMVDQAESPMYDLQFELKNTEEYKGIIDKMEFVIANVKDLRRMEEVFSKFKPQVVYHAAAYKHVPFMEENPYEAVLVNVYGTKNIADLSVKYGVEKFVMISTDKAVNPTNVMGATKRIAEIYTQSRKSGTRFVTTRFGNVLGSNGSVIPLFMKQLAHGGPLTVTDKRIIRYFMTIPEACSLVLEAGSIGSGGDVFVFDMGDPVKIYDLAKRMIQLSNMPDVKIVEIGLRPGEKLYEELLATKEDTIPTHHPKIKHAKVREYEVGFVNEEIDGLINELNSLDQFRIVAQMKKIVPEFVSNNSVFSKLDNPK